MPLKEANKRKQSIMNRKKIYVFDFDGTLTTSDTLLLFIRHVCGGWRMAAGFALYLPWLVLMKARLYPNYKAKQKVFAHFFGGMSVEEFDAHCRRFAEASGRIVRPKAAGYVADVAGGADALIVVSASLDNWVRPMVERWLGAEGSAARFTVVGTQPEVRGGRLTGRFATPNCYGAEKVRRLREVLTGDRQQYFITAFGDSRGDKQLLEYADEAHYKPFRD